MPWPMSEPSRGRVGIGRVTGTDCDKLQESLAAAARETGIDTVVDVSGQLVKLTHPPEDLGFDER